MIRSHWVLLLVVIVVAIPLASCGRRGKPRHDSGKKVETGMDRRARGGHDRWPPRGHHMRPSLGRHMSGINGTRSRRPHHPFGSGPRKPGRHARWNGTRRGDRGGKSPVCPWPVKRLHEKAKSILNRHGHFDAYFRRLVVSAGNVTHEALREKTMPLVLRRCNVVHMFVTKSQMCPKRRSTFLSRLRMQFNKVRAHLGHAARHVGICELRHLCACDGDAGTMPGDPAQLNDRKCHVSWKLIRRCSQYYTLQCAATQSNLSLDYSQDLCSAATANLTRYLAPHLGMPGHKGKKHPLHKPPPMPGFVKWNHPTGSKGKGRNSTWGKKIKGRGGDENNAMRTPVAERPQSKTAGILALQIVIAVAIFGFVVILVLYIRKRYQHAAMVKRSGSCSSISTDITDTGEYYAKASPLDYWSSQSDSSQKNVDEKKELGHIVKHGWHNPVYVVQEEAGENIYVDGPESAL